MKIKLIYHSDINGIAKETVPRTIKNTFRNVVVEEEEGLTNISFAYNNYRKQYDAEKILSKLISTEEPVFLAILPFDIYVLGLNFVFGVAFPGQGCVISTFRLKISADKNLYINRLAKTVRHELGHVFGLRHCENPCVMRFANSLYELDLKSSNFCPTCREKLMKLGLM
ncbi:MAG: archaemetzincin family Zn-dependent metalloprotease [Candidatus Njordarchaeales archaeon]